MPVGRALSPIFHHRRSSSHRYYFTSTNRTKWANRLFWGSAFGLFLLFQYRRYKQDAPPGITPAHQIVLHSLPLRLWTGVVRLVSQVPIPTSFLRERVLGLFSSLTGCNVQEAEKRLSEYRTLGDFFSRRLKTGCRPIDEQWNVIVSPCDARVVHTGHVSIDSTDTNSDPLSKIFLEQIKGSTYSLSHFLDHDPTLKARLITPWSIVSGTLKKPLHYVTLYLAPGDYHRFHAPCAWSLDYSKPVHGELLSVTPRMLRFFPSLFAINQRHLLAGTCTSLPGHPSLIMVPVGATGVGSIEVTRVPGDTLKKGDEVGTFKLGSTVVLIMNSDELEWIVQPGDRIQMGQSIGKLKQSRESGFFSSILSWFS